MKITNRLRDDIKRAICKKTIDVEREKLEAEIKQLVLDFIDSEHSPHKEMLKKLPEEYKFHVRSFRVEIESGSYFYVNMDDEILIKSPWKYGSGYRSEGALDVGKKASPKFYPLFKAIYQKKWSIERSHEEFKSELSGILAGINTVAQLKKSFPDIEQFIVLPKESYPIAISSDKIYKLINPYMGGEDVNKGE